MKPKICPYPGLRPFTEEESIFFKGRDLHIRQIVKLLEENKMAFITGASGDGKSSMVYAGVVPYIRAGFFKAGFNSWIITDFKPQRNPLKSLSEAFAKETNLNYKDVYEEFSNGFSAIIDIYKKEGLYVKDEKDAVNKGKNLLIIADQFEEVFTNSDNFNDGIPSEESYTTINLLLETIRIAVSENLPVYVIFTMRSDFISQCTVFKNLPEFIAYSQFFVPQLKRTEICQVIEEPAILAGGSVSSRLTEVIVNNLNSGFDQLPVLQHALNLLWKMADNGEKQLDLIHLAKIAGISKDVLSQEEQKEFDQWFKKRPDYEKKYFEKPDLNNVLNAHAGILYESAFDYFQNNAPWATKNITKDESKEIIKAVFKSLTKIDNNRSVRNRCTLNEITGIINKYNINNATVCGVINIYRSPENTLLRPFCETGNLETVYLSGDTVLDVTHEALIRNWKLLTQWDAEEEANTKDFFDFKSQMLRWVGHEKDSEFLLPVGTYNYFSNWYDKCRPNPFWIAKYDNSKISESQKLKNAEHQFENCVDYLEESNIAILEKEKAKKRKIRLGLIISAVIALILAGFSSWAAYERSIAEEEKKRAEEQTTIAHQQELVAIQESQKALDASELAQKEEERAKKEAEKAKKAQIQTQIAYEQAQKERLAAIAARKEALLNLEEAKLARENADLERHKAEDEAYKAKVANDSAARLNQMMVSTLYTMKAKNQYEDKNLSLRIAWEAYCLSRKNNEKQNEAELYDAILFALEESGVGNELLTTEENIADFTIDNQNRIIIITQNGAIEKYKFVNEKLRRFYKSDKFLTKSPVEEALFLSENFIVYSTKDRNTYFIDLENETKTKLSGINGDYVSAASLAQNKEKLVIATSNGKTVAYDRNKIEDKPSVTAALKSKVTDFYSPKNSDEIYVLLHNGNLLKWNLSNNSLKQVPSETTFNALALAPIEDKHLLAVCYFNGNINFFDTQKDKCVKTMLSAHSSLENIVYDKNTELLAVSSADKRISLINTKNLNAKPFAIEEHSLEGQKVKAMKFNDKGMIFAVTFDNALRYWDTDIRKYAQTLQKMNLQKLTEEEKELILGREFANKK